MTALVELSERERTPERAAIASVLMAMMLVVLSAAMIHVALPSIAGSLQISSASAVQIVTAYQLALVMALLPAAALGESLGYRPVFMAGVAVFMAASTLCARSASLHALVIARFVQGLGGAAVMALGVPLLRSIVPQRQVATAIGWNALVVALSSAAGPALGAMVLASASWPWLFAVHMPLGAVVLIAARALPDVRGSGRKVDGISVLLNAAAFAALIAGLQLLPAARMKGSALLVAASLTMLVLVRRERPTAAPLIPLDLLRARAFRIAVIASICCFTGQAAALVALPFYLQQNLGLDAFTSGLMIMPWPLSVALMAPVAGRLTAHVASAWLCAAGGVCLALGLGTAALWPLQAGVLPLLASVALCGVGFGLFQVPNNRTLFLSAPRARSAAAGGMQGTARLLGQTLGAVAMGMLFASVPGDSAPRTGLALGALLTLSAGLVSTRRA